ncbi:MAG TPA: hypothetical protein VI776_02190 [Anaerolineales bacterium]|nr:hypothetical protein [Anaerolineales bacterium]
MVVKPSSITRIGFVQVILAATFVVWLVLFPDTGVNFAWPIAPRFTAMFIGAAFMVRTFIGYFLWREKTWNRLTWQMWGNYAFLIVVFLATFWHIDEMNWKANIIVAHVWVIAYLVEPLILPLVEPRGAHRNPPQLPEDRRGPIFTGLKRVMVAGLVVSVTMVALMFLNPLFLDTRWPWALDPFDARIMSAFFALTSLWCVTVYFAEDWGEIRLAVFGLSIFAVAQFLVWLVILPQLDPARPNIYSYGVGFGLFAVLLVYYSVRQELAARKASLLGVAPEQ